MQNADSNMGMKLSLFHPKTEIKIIWDRGIHVMPGFLTSIEITTCQGRRDVYEIHKRIIS